MTTIDTRELRNAFGSFLTGVTVVTSANSDGDPVGFTANSYTSVSLNPPLLLVCPAKTLGTIDIFSSCDRFAVNILALDQQEVSNTFASSGNERFSTIAWQADQWNMPILDGTVGHFSCSTHQCISAGDHFVLIGLVENFQTSNKTGLGYLKGSYLNLEMERKSEQLINSKPTVIIGAIVTCKDKVFLSKTQNGYSLPNVTLSVKQNASTSISSFLNDKNINADVGSVYSIFDDTDTATTYSFYLAKTDNTDSCELGDYYPINDLASLDFVSPAIKSMMLRYSQEQKTRAFGLYIGDQLQGDIH